MPPLVMEEEIAVTQERSSQERNHDVTNEQCLNPDKIFLIIHQYDNLKSRAANAE